MTDRTVAVSRSPVTRLCLLTLAAVMLAACSDVRQSLGLARSTPDEFAVVTRAPLAMPPNYDMQPPQPGAQRPQETTTRQDARQTVFRSGQVDGGEALTGPQATGQVSAGERTVLSRAGADQADPDIRSQVDRESRVLAASERSFVDGLLFWQSDRPSGPVVDAPAEAERIRGNEAAGRAITEGETPVIERRRRAPLEGLFN